jgi:probable selenium-dependent hydroxylase accessory protein YqeC
MKLSEGLEIKKNEIVSLVGGGGKTTLMFALAKELTTEGSYVITTTTTKIITPSLSDTGQLILTGSNEIAPEIIQSSAGRYHHVTVAREKLPSDKLDGVDPETVRRLSIVRGIDYVIVEADGAAQHSLKAPCEDEPVIPVGTTTVVVIAGIDALGGRLDQVVFRPEIAAALLGVAKSAFITPEMMAELITGRIGMTRGSPPTARIIPFINKVEITGGLEKGRQVARAVLKRGHPQIERVILGQVKYADPVLEVIC